MFLVIEPNAPTRHKLLQQIQQPIFWAAADLKPALIAVPRHVDRLLELGSELAALEWVQAHANELSNDLVAQREVATRVAAAERDLRLELTRVLDGSPDCVWWTKLGQQTVDSARALAQVISSLCDEADCKAPWVHNELLNRRQLSSAAAAARRTLMEAMVTRPGVVRLGFEGTPPEVSMYRSVLEHHGLHRVRDGRLGLEAPTAEIKGSLEPAWSEIERALNDAREARLRVPALYERLKNPPYGLRDGLLPVLLVAAMVAFKDEMSLYRGGVFVPKLNADVLSALAESPESFEVQRIGISGPRAALYERLFEVLSGGRGAAPPGVVPIVRALVQAVHGLPELARTTATVSAGAQAVRDALLHAREPAPLLFSDLPRACGPAGARRSAPMAPSRPQRSRASWTRSAPRSESSDSSIRASSIPSRTWCASPSTFPRPSMP